MRLRHLILSAGLAALAATGAQAQVMKFKNPAGASPSPILQGAEIKAGTDIFYLSGQLASPLPASASKKPSEMTMDDFGDMKTQTISVLTKIKKALEEHGYTLNDVVKSLVIMAPGKDGKLDFAGMNEGWKMFFNTAETPSTTARSAFQAGALAGPNYLVEIEVIAAKKK
ncbi:enamine deaminase RidA (YjgF/YER057c/UK114 family) [Sphingomonas vulcanisoli]|uniref:Enamine deaminase RidA (YjgF/YER057c/UK114 family) n=1 Tax=Sphingomonas vulcanisoli TaxID=1658060 RepID=A0ABX0TSP6_9SPHN|nr:Rid family hydrolase [Sphingomonas vulcanisoli]NIJ07159.1 enamine deaminase RidA (YjgF/YER057c/UK114 family) [Sphingomonas vulcanisoli]